MLFFSTTKASAEYNNAALRLEEILYCVCQCHQGCCHSSSKPGSSNVLTARPHRRCQIQYNQFGSREVTCMKATAGCFSMCVPYSRMISCLQQLLSPHSASPSGSSNNGSCGFDEWQGREVTGLESVIATWSSLERTCSIPSWESID